MAVVEILCVNVVELATKCGTESNPVWLIFSPCKHPVLKIVPVNAVNSHLGLPTQSSFECICCEDTGLRH